MFAMFNNAIRSSLVVGTAIVALSTPLAAQQRRPAPAPKGETATSEFVTGRFDNGLRYVIKPHDSPPGRVSMRLLMKAGSGHERHGERGAAAMVQRMAHHGSTHFPPGEAEAFLDSLDSPDDRRGRGHVSFDHTVFQLTLPAEDPRDIRRAMLLFADAVSGLTFPQEQIEQQRRALLKERRLEESPRRRVFEQLLPRVAPDSHLAARLPDAPAEAVRALDRQTLVTFYERTYSPAAATLIVVGDIEPERILAPAREMLGGIPARPAPKPPDARITPYTEAFAVIVSDEDLSAPDFAVLRIDKPAPAKSDAQASRTRSLRELAMRVLRRRLKGRIWLDDAPLRDPHVYMGEVFGAMRLAQVSASAPIERWRDVIGALVAESRRVRVFGLSEAEVDLAKKALLAEVEREARREASEPADRLVRRITKIVLDDRAIRSAERRVEMTRRLLANIGADEVAEALADRLDPSRLAYIAELPGQDGAPTEQQLLAAARDAIKAPLDHDPLPSPPQALLSEAPEPGTVSALTIEPQAGVMSAWLGDGVRFHHRRMDAQPGEATLAITLAGGVIEETGRQRGLTRAAAAAMERPASQRLDALQIDDVLTGRDIELKVDVDLDAVTLLVRASSEQLKTAFELAHLLLTEPRLERSAFERWKRDRIEKIRRRRAYPHAMLQDLLAEALYPPQERRPRRLTRTRIEKIELEPLQRWLKDLIAHSPIEAAVVGDVDRRRAMTLAAQYLGSLPSRPRISDSTLDDKRNVAPVEPPHHAEVGLRTRAAKAVVAVGCLGADAAERDDARHLHLASRIIDRRLTLAMREHEAVTMVSAFNRPAEAFPGFGLFGAWAETEPPKADALADRFAEALRRFADEGPSEEEFHRAKERLIASIRADLSDPKHWAKRLAEAEYRGLAPAEMVEAPSRVESAPAERIRQAVAERIGDEPSIRVIITTGP